MTIKVLSACAAAMFAGAVCAQEDSAESETPAADAAKQEQASPAKAFTALPFCQMAEGIAEARLPGAEAWVAVEEGKFYPLGTGFRTRGEKSSLSVSFGTESKVSVEGDASFGTKAQALGAPSRTVVIGEGVLKLDLARNLPEGAFFVTAAGFSLKNLAGESSIRYRKLPDGDEAVIRCVTGSLGVYGRHFDIPQMRAADEIRIRSTVDYLTTFLYGNSGDYIVKLDRGVVTRNDIDEEGKVKVVTDQSTLDWHLSPKTKVRIDRMVPSVGERLSVAMMTFDAAGELKNNFAYAEGRAEVNSGELAEAAAAEGAAAVKKATEEAEETTTTAAEDETEASDEDSKKDNNNKEE